MKRYLVLLLLVGTSLTTVAQTLATELLWGGWITTNANRFTRITVSPNLPQQVYRIESVLFTDTSTLQYNIIVDGVVQPTSFYEGSVVVVEGKDIAIQQVNPGASLNGTWRMIQKPAAATTSMAWAGYARLNRDILVASLKTEQEFVLSINNNIPNCTATAMQVLIDGVSVKDAANQPLVFMPGSYIYGRGKVITLRPIGNCTGVNNPVMGSIKLLAARP
jgi:hypothetical protein